MVMTQLKNLFLFNLYIIIKNNIFFIKLFVINNFNDLVFFFNLSLVSFLFFKLYFYVSIKIFQVLKKRKFELYFFNYFEVFVSFLVILIYTVYYIIFIRILAFFSNKKFDINIYVIKDLLISYANERENFGMTLFLIFFVVMFFYFCFFCLNYYFFFKTKIHFLKLHYYYFMKFSSYRTLISETKKLELKILKLLSRRYKYYFFIKFFGFKVIIILVIFYVLFDGNLDYLLRIIPYYSLYHFILNINSYIIYIFEFDFEILVMESYYPRIHFFFQKNEKAKLEYKKFLILNFSEYEFKDSIFLHLNIKQNHNCFMVQIYKYDLNKFPYDFFSQIKGKKPQFMRIGN